MTSKPQEIIAEYYNAFLSIFKNRKQERIFSSWFKDRGDETHRVNYNLNENSIVFDIGGYKGDWTEKIYDKYHCHIYIFEPVSEFFDELRKKFSKNEKIKIYKIGLSNEDTSVDIGVNNDSSSIYKKENKIQRIQLVDAANFINSMNLDHIDIMKINIEGGEYLLLENLIKSDTVKIIQDIQIQFHNFVPDADKKMNDIQNELQKTHYITYQYRFVWENWKRKQNNHD